MQITKFRRAQTFPFKVPKREEKNCGEQLAGINPHAGDPKSKDVGGASTEKTATLGEKGGDKRKKNVG